MIIQAELRRKQSGSGSSAVRCWRTTILSQKTKMPSGTMAMPVTACSSLTQTERTVSSLIRRGITIMVCK